MAPSREDRLLGKKLAESNASNARIAAEFLLAAADLEEMLNRAGILPADFGKDPTLFPRMFEGKAELLGRYFMASARLTQLQNETRDLTKLNAEEKRTYAKRFHELGIEFKSIADSLT